MNERVLQGDLIDAKKINKHLNDIVKLSTLLQSNRIIELPEKIRIDLQAFAKSVVELNQPDLSKAIHRIAISYDLNL